MKVSACVTRTARPVMVRGSGRFNNESAADDRGGVPYITGHRGVGHLGIIRFSVVSSTIYIQIWEFVEETAEGPRRMIAHTI